MEKKRGRVVGLDVHPDSFAGAVVEATDPLSAQVLSTSTRVQLEQLERWTLHYLVKCCWPDLKILSPDRSMRCKKRERFSHRHIARSVCREIEHSRDRPK